jgi:hypothetical protein
MDLTSSDYATLETLKSARCIADYAVGMGINTEAKETRPITDHLGAVLADAALQAGLNYRSVVRPRVERILHQYPDAADMVGLQKVLENRSVAEFLQWKHPDKIGRFTALRELLQSERLQTVADLRRWLLSGNSRNALLDISGVGPKTVDYLCCLVGIDCIPVDRHVKLFAKNAGIEARDYEGIRLAVSFAADLLGISRRTFDAWLWKLASMNT